MAVGVTATVAGNWLLVLTGTTYTGLAGLWVKLEGPTGKVSNHAWRKACIRSCN